MSIKFSATVWILVLTAILPSSPAIVAAADADAIVGLWDTSEKDAKVEISECDTGYCGRIAYLEEPCYPPDDKGGMAGLPMVDRNNPNRALRGRPLEGLRFMEGFRYVGDNTWDGGRVYNPENGKFYKAMISFADSHRLRLRGYLGISLLGRTETWTRSAVDPEGRPLDNSADLRHMRSCSPPAAG